MNTEPIAIVGLAGRFPGARDVNELWNNIINGVESILTFTNEELIQAGLDPALVAHPNYVKAGTVLDDAELFDAEFFGFSSREAEILDPQQRVFLECCYNALENAACDPAAFPGRIGVFAGSAISSYLLTNLMKNPRVVETVGQFQTLLANDKDYLATRVSYKLNLRGPSMTVQSACSTSLVAVHLGCESLRRRESDACLAGGISLSFPQRAGYIYKPGMISSPDGHCRSFDAEAQGTIFGKGCAVVVMKRLADAVAEGDPIVAVIKGSAINNDGSGKVGYTAPATAGQTDVIRRSQEMAGFHPDTIGFVEAHGTGTELGDPIEAAALMEVFREKTDGVGFCALGSIKTNIGHLDSAAGVTGLIKCALVLKNQMIPPTLHFKRANPLIKMESGPFFVNTEVVQWETKELRRAGVNSFGVGGTNAHACLEEAPVRDNPDQGSGYQLFPISAKTETALEQVRTQLVEHLETKQDDYREVAETLQSGRRAFVHRQIAVAANLQEAAEAFRNQDSKKTGRDTAGGKTPDVVFLFPGQGSQQVNMARHIYEEDALFRADVDSCCDAFQPLLGRDLRGLLFPEGADVEAAAAALQETVNTQAVLFVIEYSLARMYLRAGVVPSAMLGHSIGEYVAACIADVFSVEDGIRLVATRGRLMQSTRPGAMTTVTLSEDECEPYLFNGLSISVVNAPKLCVVSGESESIARFEDVLKQKKVATFRLRTSHAFHSSTMEPVLAEFGAFVRTVSLRAPRIPFVSNVTATWISDAQATDPEYWVRHLRSPVRFSASLELLLQRAKAILVEVGTGQSLTPLVRQHKTTSGDAVVYGSLPARAGMAGSVPPHLLTIGKLWCAGLPVKWRGLAGKGNARKVALPNYPFERKKYWVEPETDGTSQSTPQKQAEIEDWFYAPSWLRSIPAVPKDAAGEKTWLCFSDAPAAVAGWSQQFERLGRRLIQVIRGGVAGAADPENADVIYLEGPTAADYTRVFSRLPARNIALEGLIFCVPGGGQSGQDSAARVRSAHEAFNSFVYLTQAYNATRDERLVQIEVVTSGLREVLGETITGPEKAAVFGLCHAIRAELPNTACRTIDVEDLASAAALVTSEILAGPSNEAVAYRSGRRWVQAWEKAKLGAPQASAKVVFREGAVCLITGGMGGIGLELARYLAANFSAKLVLLQRSELPRREEWDAILASSDAGDRVRSKIEIIRELESAGGEVEIVSADVSSREQVQQAWQRAKERFGRIDSVLHAAGVGYIANIDSLSPDDYQTTLLPKLEGTLFLSELAKRDEVGLVVLFSSISTVLSSFGYAPYAGGNCALDAFAYSGDFGEKTRVVAINWDTWLEVGMGVPAAASSGLTAAQRQAAERLEQAAQLANRHGILPKEGVEAFVRILQSSLPQAVVSTRDLTRVLLAESKRRLESNQKLTSSSVQMQTRAVGPDYVPASNEEEAGIVSIWEELIGVQPIGVTDDFFELGGHSLLGTEVLARIRSRFDVQLSLRTIFEATTPGDLAAYVQTARAATASVGNGEPGAWEELEI